MVECKCIYFYFIHLTKVWWQRHLVVKSRLYCVQSVFISKTPHTLLCPVWLGPRNSCLQLYFSLMFMLRFCNKIKNSENKHARFTHSSWSRDRNLSTVRDPLHIRRFHGYRRLKFATRENLADISHIVRTYRRGLVRWAPINTHTHH